MSTDSSHYLSAGKHPQFVVQVKLGNGAFLRLECLLIPTVTVLGDFAENPFSDLDLHLHPINFHCINLDLFKLPPFFVPELQNRYLT